MSELIALRSLKYATRHLEAGDSFTAATDRDARTLTAIRKARYLTEDEIAKREKKEIRAEVQTAIKAPEPAKTAEPAKIAEPVKVSAPVEPAPKQKSGDELTADELLDIMDDLPFMTFKSKATQILGDKTPTTKADIIAALESHAKTA